MRSGEVPRQLAPGVMWDEAAEAAFSHMFQLLLAKGFADDYAEREARWSVELVLHRRLIGDQVRAAMACSSNADKRALYGWWVKKLGQAKADELAAFVKDERMRSKVASWR